MVTLAFDSCFGAVSAALGWTDAEGVHRCDFEYEPCRSGHAERLFPMIEGLLGRAGIQARQIERLAATLGPGTFTGVRTSVAAARGLALASGAEVVGTSSLAVIAEAFQGQSQASIAVAADARKGEVYLQLFSASGSATGAPQLLPVAEAAALLEEGPWFVVGSAAQAISAAVAGAVRIERVVVDAEPDARSLLRLAGRLPPLARVTPIYVRSPDALPQSGKALPRARG